MEEDSYIVSNFHSICRLCLRKNGVMSPIFDHLTEDMPLYAKIAEIVEVQILPNDGLPASICHRCLYKTEKCVKFRSKCAASDAKLRRLTRKRPTHAAETDQDSPPTLVPDSEEFIYQNSEQLLQKFCKTESDYIVEDSVVMVVDPSIMDYDTSDQSDNDKEQEDSVVLDNDNSDDTPRAPSLPKKVFMCQYCDQAFTEITPWREHEKMDHDEKAPWGCEACGLVFAERAGHAAHARSVHACERPYTCSQCDKAFGRRSDLRKHSVVHTGVRPYRCHFCLKSFSRNTNLSKHLRIHSGQKPHVCPQCPRSFISKGDLSRHALVHSGAKPFSCTVCPLTFSRRDKLAKHEARHIKNNENKETEINAPLGEDIVVNLDPYKNMQEHFSAEPLSPDRLDRDEYPRIPDHISGESGFSFEAQQQMLKEERISPDGVELDDMTKNGVHENGQVKKNVKSISCEQCPKKFTSAITYKKHLAIHSAARSFRCKICNKSFSRKRELDRHAVVHTGFKPFECTRCDKKFGRKDKLVRHERIHDEKKEYMCFECPATFTRKDSLVTHVKTHFPDLVNDDVIHSDDDANDEDGTDNDE